jgi:ATP-dependent DNA helicase RecG
MRYEDETQLWTIAEALAQSGEGAVQTQGVVTRSQVLYRPRRQLLVTITDNGDVLNLRWLHFYPSQQKQMALGAHLRVRGEIRDGYLGAEMVHPTIRAVPANAPLPKSLTPVYSVTAGISQAMIRKAVLVALNHPSMQMVLAEIIPPVILETAEKAAMQFSLRDAVMYLHQPPADANTNALIERTHPAWRRVQLEELLAQQLSLKQAHELRKSRASPPKILSNELARTAESMVTDR